MYNVKPITEAGIWDDFIAKVRPSTFLHTWSSGELEKHSNREIFRFGVFDSADNLKSVVLAVKVTARRGTFLLCPHGPIIGNENSEQFSDIVKVISKELIRIAKENKCVFLRVSTSIVASPDRIKAFKKLGFRNAPIHVHSELSWILNITKSENVLLNEMKKNTRYGIRKAERDGIKIVSSTNPEDIEVFWNLHQKTAIYHSFVPYSKDYIYKEFLEFSKTDSARWYFAHYNNEVVSAAMIIFTPWSAFYHHGASLHSHSSITPSELLQWQAIIDAKKRGCSTYNFWGVIVDDNSHHPWAGLSRFKKGFGGYDEAYIHAQDYPLSWKYWITYGIETIRKWKRKV